MPDKSFTSSERKGILAVAGIALLVIALGFCAGLCSRNGDALPVDEMEEVMVLDSVPYSETGSVKDNDTVKKISSGKKETTRKKKNSTKKKKTYRRRDPRDEIVDIDR